MTRADTAADVIIIGAGPGGSTAAIDLARAHRRVLLIERKPFPRDKICGGCLSGRAMRHLQRLIGNAGRLPGAPAARITFVIGRYRLECRPHGRTRVVARRDLDARLAQCAVDAGAEVRFGLAAELVCGDGGWLVAAGDERLRAGTVLLAGGVGSVPGRLGLTPRDDPRRMISLQWVQPLDDRLPDPGCVELHWLRGGYVGLATPGPTHCVVALAAKWSDRPHEDAWTRLRRLNPTAPIMAVLPPDAPARYDAKGTAGFPHAPARRGRENLLLVGDAAGYEEPFTGEGIGLAMISGACAARAVLKGGDVLRNYTRLMRWHHRPIVQRTRWLSRALDTRPIQFLCSKWPVLPPRMLAPLVRYIHVGGSI